MTDLTLTRGDAGVFNITVTMPDGADLTGCSLSFMAKQSSRDADELAVINKTVGDGITITDVAAKTAQLRIEPDDTANLDAPAILVWDLVLTDASSDPYTVASGRLTLTASVRRTK